MKDQHHFQSWPDAPPRKARSLLNVLPPHSEKESEEGVVQKGRFPSWLHRRLPKGGNVYQTGHVLHEQRLHTVCEEAKCPNLLDCWSRQTATFLVMGKACTRNCGFCSIDFTKTPEALDQEEPQRLAESVKVLNLKHVVITMVARDDLPDGGSAHLVKVMQAVRQCTPDVTIEVLTSDFDGQVEAWQTILKAEPQIFNHNLETVRELTPRVRHRATYDRSLEFLRYMAKYRLCPSLKIKSGLMVGLGETEEQVFETLRDLKETGCEIVIIGQYLQPTAQKLRVKSFVPQNNLRNMKLTGIS